MKQLGQENPGHDMKKRKGVRRFAIEKTNAAKFVSGSQEKCVSWELPHLHARGFIREAADSFVQDHHAQVGRQRGPEAEDRGSRFAIRLVV